MREILFRGKGIYTNKWVEGSLVIFPNTGRIKILKWNNADLDFDQIEVNPETVGQYTGLTDNNGTKIFEGDIVEGADFTIEDGGYGLISFEDGAFEVNGNNIIGTFHENYWGKEFEVIGNIHDNPELY